MLQSLLGAIVETLLSAAVAAIVRFFGLEDAVKFATALFGLACIVIGVVIACVGH
jgi:hypothetical protein